MRTTGTGVIALALVVGLWSMGNLGAAPQVKLDDQKIDIVDNCLPGDPGYDDTGGCLQKPQDGDVSFAEFGAFLTSPLTDPPHAFLIGHPSWRNDPSYVSIKERKTVQLKNTGGRTHTFTEVANYGGGFVADLNIGLTPAPECNPALVVFLPAGAADRVSGLAPGLHKFQCCIHPWMRAAIRVN